MIAGIGKRKHLLVENSIFIPVLGPVLRPILDTPPTPADFTLYLDTLALSLDTDNITLE